ncbi:DHH family phosphoesterase [Halorarius litoreus]|uniref:DHH family phosphoesterase n=1 Tax=Halorarius litoreus TaxID=2962676 RepID=UPI0020CE6043|nr:DHH family phosphoesterase [Halorarius litoreus]
MLAALGRVLAVAVGDPLVLAAVGLGLLTAGIAGGWGIKRWLEAPVDRLCRVLKRRDEVVVLMHPNPDPDAMASAMAVAHLAESVGTEVTLQHAGAVKHYQNQAFVATFDLEFEPIEDANWLACRDVVLVDHNEPRGFAGSRGLDPIAVLDHHPGEGTGTEFTDVRPDYGACATLLTEYLRDRAGDEPLPTPLATALLQGIQSDTHSLTRGCTPAEFEASAYLYSFADPQLLDQVATPSVPGEFLDVQARAITNRQVTEPVAISDVGEVETVDAIAAAADELLRLDGTDAVVVYGANDETLHLSARSSDAAIHVGKALREAVDDIPMASAGGHARMGGGQLSIPHLDGIGPGPGVSRSELRQRLLDAMLPERTLEVEQPS